VQVASQAIRRADLPLPDTRKLWIWFQASFQIINTNLNDLPSEVDPGLYCRIHFLPVMYQPRPFPAKPPGNISYSSG